MKPSRITTQSSFLDLVDILGRGGTEEWRDLYLRAKQEPELRKEIREALALVDPDLGANRELWFFLLSKIESGEAKSIEQTTSNRG